MYLSASQKRRLEDSTLTPDERSMLRCKLAKRLEDSGSFEAAREALGPFWRGLNGQPEVKGLDEKSAAEVILRCGTLSGWIASNTQFEGGQEPAKDLLSLGIRRFEALGLWEKVAEAEIELAYCYWREGNYDEALVWLREARTRLEGQESDLMAVAQLRTAIVIFNKGSYREAIRILEENSHLFEKSSSHALKGKFHVNLATLYKEVGEVEQDEAATDRALIEYAVAGYHFEQAKHYTYRAGIENQLGFLFATKGCFKESHEHLNRARRFFTQLKDKVRTAIVDETRARTFLAEGSDAEAEKAARSALYLIERGGHQAMLAEALITLGIVQARRAKTEPARLSFRRAAEVAESSGDSENAARAEITMLEELSSQIRPEEMTIIYSQADLHLASSNNPNLLSRLRACARSVITTKRTDQHQQPAPHITDQNKVTPEELIQNTERSQRGQHLEVEWAGFSLPKAVGKLEETLIERALHDAGGSISRAAKLLGLPGHSSLSSKLKGKAKELSDLRTPVRRRRSIIPKVEKKSKDVKGH